MPVGTPFFVIYNAFSKKVARPRNFCQTFG
jgi:hypothetical protein